MSLLDDPDYLPFKLDLVQRRVLMLQLSAAQRAQAAFLDERALPAAPVASWVPLSLLAEPDVAVGASRAPLDFVFHIGHCGSTLLSRLLQSWSDCQALREPLPLRTLAAAFEDGSLPAGADQALLAQLLALWRRPTAAATRTVIKATSSCNGLIAPIMAAHEASRAVLLDMPLVPYLSTLFKARASIGDALAAEPGRRADLARRLETTTALQAQTTPERCALGWLAERMRFDALSQGTQGARILRIDFERLLADRAAVLSQIAAHFGLPGDGLQAALASPAWSRYSKADAHAYDAADRQHDLALAGRRFAADIEAGERWLERFVRHHPQCAVAVA